MAQDAPKKAAAEAKSEEEPKVEVSAEALALADIASNIALLVKSVKTAESRFCWRVLRSLPVIRKKLTPAVLRHAIAAHVANAGEARADALLTWIETSAMDEAPDEAASKDSSLPTPSPSDVVEVELYLHLLVVIFLIDNDQDAIECAEHMIKRCVETKRRTSDLISARCYFYYARTHELKGSYPMIRGTLNAAYRTASMRCDEIGQAVLLNLLLRNYLSEHLVAQADLLVSKTTFPETAPNNETARYMYYLGKIKAIQLDYSEADQHLFAAVRKAPASAIGFLEHATKLAVIVKMLLGEIPERDIFRQPSLERSLRPYFELTQAVRSGDMSKFTAILEEFGSAFKTDETYTLIMRLRHNVIKAGVRIISLSYSRISLEAIAEKLLLDSADDAEYIVAKCIRDGVIDATIDHENRYVASKDVVDVYATGEPQEAFHQRISFCLKLHNDSVKSMRYPPNAYRKYLETPEQRRDREQLEVDTAVENASGKDKASGDGF